MANNGTRISALYTLNRKKNVWGEKRMHDLDRGNSNGVITSSSFRRGVKLIITPASSIRRSVRV